MADYYSILKKTIASLPESNGAARRSVYSRARNAIVNQLKAYEPPLSPSEITSEQLRLEEAIRKVEAEAARESLGLGPTTPEKPVQQSTATSTTETSVAPETHATPSVAPPLSPEVGQTPVPAVDASQPPQVDGTLSETGALGAATDRPAENVAEIAEQPSPAVGSVVQEQRHEPAFNSPADDTSDIFETPEAASVGVDDRLQASRDRTEAVDQPTSASVPAERVKRPRTSASEALGDKSGNSKLLPLALAAVLTVAVLGAGVYYLVSSDNMSASTDEPDSQSPQVLSAQQPEDPVSTTESADVSADNGSEKNTDRLNSGDDTDVVAPDALSVTTTTINPDPNNEAATSQPSIVTNVESTPSPENPEPVPDTATSANVEAPTTSEQSVAAVTPKETTPSSSEGASVQRSILYEEGEDAGGAGTAAQGAVVWNLAEETGLDGKAHSVLSASVEIPERDVKVDIRFKPNDDTSLPASHLVEIKYELPGAFASGDIVNVPGLVMKPTEEARGDALIGASVKVSPGYFWIALSNLPNEQQRNLALLRERGWIDIPMLYENGKRGILTIEKGSIGSDAVEKAVAAWNAG